MKNITNLDKNQNDINNEGNPKNIIKEYKDNKNENREFKPKAMEENDKSTNGDNLKSKQSKSFQKFKQRFIKKIGTELKIGGGRFAHPSSKILNMASQLEDQFGKTERGKPLENEEYNFRSVNQLSKSISMVDIIDKKPVSLNKKKSKRIIFSSE